MQRLWMRVAPLGKLPVRVVQVDSVPGLVLGLRRAYRAGLRAESAVAGAPNLGVRAPVQQGNAACRDHDFQKNIHLIQKMRRSSPNLGRGIGMIGIGTEVLLKRDNHFGPMPIVTMLFTQARTAAKSAPMMRSVLLTRLCPISA